MSINLTVVIDNEEAIRKFRELQKTAKTVTSSVVTDADRMDIAMRRIATTLGQVGVAVSLTGLIRQIALTRGEFQQLEVAFSTLLQSKEKADKLMAEMVDLAAKTPFDLQGVASGARQLLAYGFAAEEITDTLTRLGNVAAGLGLPLERLTYLYGTTAVQGRLYARDMLQFTSSGIPVLQEMAKMYGKTTEEINKMVTDGKIGFEDVRKVIENMTNEGGQFYNLMQGQSKTITGLISNLGDALDTMFNDIGKSQEGVISDVLKGTISLVENYQKVLDILIPLVAAYGAYKTALIVTAALQKAAVSIETIQRFYQLAKGIETAAQAQRVLNLAVKSNPLGLALSVLTLLGTAAYKYANGAYRAADAQKLLNDNMAEAASSAAIEQSELARLKGKLQACKEGTEEYDRVKNEIIKKFGKYDEGLTAETLNVDTLAQKYNSLTEAIMRSYNARQYEKFSTTQTRQLDETMTANFDKIYTNLIKRFGDEKGTELFTKIQNSIVSGADLSKDVMDAINSIQGNAYARINSGIRNIREAQKEAEKLDELARKRFGIEGVASTTTNEAETSAIVSLSDTIAAAREKLAGLKSELADLMAGKLPKGAKPDFNWAKSIEDKQKAIKEQQEELNTLIGYDPKQAKKTMQAAERDAEKAKQLRERLNPQLEEMTLKAQEAAIQAEIDLMADGTTKKLAQIDLDYQKRSRAIRKSVSELHKLWLEEYKNRNVQDKDSDQYKARQQMETQFKGNVDHLARPLIDAAELVKKGWEDAGEGIATVFSSQYGILDAKGKETEILVTPILPNGDILSPQELEDYIFNQLEGAQDILKADTKGIVIATNVSTDGSAGEKYHQLQGEYYADAIEFAESLRIRTQALNDANEAIRQSERHEAIAGKPAKIDLWKDFEEDEKAWNEYYEKYGTFRERLQATKDKYDRKLAEAQNEGERTSIQAEYDAALAQLEIESSSWAKELINKTISELENIQTQLENELEAAKRTFNAFESSSDPEAQQWAARINKLEAQLKALTPQINKAKKAASDNDWAKGALALNAIADGAREALNGVRDLDEGLADALETLVNIAGSAGSFADSIKGIKGGDLSFGSIAGTITSGISLISSIVGLFKGGETSMERNIRLAKEFNEELRIMNEQAKINSDAFSSIFGDNAWGNYANNINVLNEAASKYGDTLERVKKRGKEVAVDFGEYGGRANLKKVDKTWENATESVANMLVQTRHSTWFRSAKYKSLKDLLPELFEGNEINMENLKKFVDSNNDTFKHLGRENQEYLKGMVADWETYQQAVEAVNDYLTDMLGDLGSSLTDALVDSFESGTDAAEAFGEAVGDMLKNMAKQVLYNATLAPLIDEAQSQIEEINKNSALSNEDRFNAYTKVIGDLMDQVLAEQEAGQDLWERLQKIAEEKGIDWTEETTSGQTATSRGFQAMSQDTGDELNGRFTDMQGKMNILVSGMDMLRSINMETRNTSIDIRDIMIQLNGNVADIRTFTKVLPEMSSTLTSMNKKLDNL